MNIFLAQLPDMPDTPGAKEVTESLSNIFKTNIKESSVEFFMKIIYAAIFFIIGVYVIKFVRKALVKYLDRSSLPIDNITFIDSIVKILLYGILIFMIAGSFGIEATSILAIVGSAGLTLGLAFQGALSNFAGGVLILMTKPFAVGDYIVVDSKFEGTVTDIAIVHTRLRTVDNRIVVIPNGTLANTTLINTTAENKRKIEIFIGVSYNSDINKVREIILEQVKNEVNIEADGDALVFLDSFEDSSMRIGLRAYVATDKFWETKWRLNEKIKEAFDKNGINIPFPQMDVHMV
ncbi:MAG: mechanosensitive ion channel family protein [Lachnospiraceae bacterium]|nr:mechanosensitive ion channel family protein [Lachnospiraceae bacterium]